MTVYFSEVDFNENIKQAFYSFCEENNLMPYNTTNGVSVFLESKNKPAYLSNTYPLAIEIFLTRTIMESNSYWNHLTIPTVHLKPLAEKLYKSLQDKNTFEILHKYITKFINPKEVCSFLSEYSKEQLERFLISSKSTKGKYWNVDEIFTYIAPLMVDKIPYDKASLLNKILKNNKVFTESIEFKRRLYTFVHTYIDEGYRKKFSDYYKDVEKVESKEVSLFSSPGKNLILDINKVSFKNCMLKNGSGNDISDTQITNFFNSLIGAMKHKNVAKYLGVDSANIYQKQQQYESFRLVIDINKNKELEQKTVEEFIKLFIDGYNNTFKGLPNKDQAAKIAEKIIMVLSLSQNLVEKPSSTKPPKI
jgi:hypothetical protein